jgi:hypothetical protein
MWSRVLLKNYMKKSMLMLGFHEESLAARASDASAVFTPADASD